MSLNLNKTIIAGRLTADPELKTTPNGISVTSITVAVNRKTAAGAPQKADFFNVIAWRTTAEFICKYFKKGASIFAVGHMEQRAYETKQNQKVTVWELMVDEVDFVESKAANAATEQTPSVVSENAANFEEISSDDDLPF